MGGILSKVKNKFKGFFGQSKKLVQTPKELPDIIMQKPIPPPMIPKEQQTKEPLPTSKEAAPLPQKPSKELKLPKIEHPPVEETSETPQKQAPPIHDDVRKFEEAINNIKIDMVHSETPASITPASEEPPKYYRPVEIGEGYFSEIEHYIKNKDVNEIIDDIIKKDFLTSMKDYHNTKAEGKPFYLHTQDLKHQLKKKMDQLRKLEEEWHSLKTQTEEKEKKKIEIEKGIDQESQELKELFTQVKINEILEHQAPKEHYFKLRNGQELKSLNDLRKALGYMTEEEWNHHVNEVKNDFATWVKEALQNQEIYEKIKDIKKKEEMQELLKNPF